MIEGHSSERPLERSRGEPTEQMPSREPSRGRFPEGLKAWIRGRFSRVRRPESADSLLWNLRLASRILWAILVGLGVYVVLDLVVLHPSPHRVVGLEAGGPGAEVAPVQISNPLRPLGEYLAGILQRDPFTGSDPTTAAAVKVAATTKRKLEEAVENLVIVGIDRGPNPAALVEDKKQGRTMIVNTGDTINGVTVKKISAEGVLLSYEGEEHLLQ